MDKVLMFAAVFTMVGLRGFQQKVVAATQYPMMGIVGGMIYLAEGSAVIMVSKGGYWNVAIGAIGASTGVMMAVYFYNRYFSNLFKKKDEPMSLLTDADRDPQANVLAPLVAERIVVIAPSMRHVKALQNLLFDKLDQRPAVKLADLTLETDKGLLVFAEQKDPFKPVPKPVDGFNTKRLRFLTQEGTLELGGLTFRDSFFTADTIVLDDDRCAPLRDQTGWKWGDKDHGITSEDLLSHYPEEFEKLD